MILTGQSELVFTVLSVRRFRRTANIYFLVISGLMLIGTYFPTIFNSPLSPFTTLGPLVVVLAITMVKEVLEDAKRHRSDRDVNNRPATLLKAGGVLDDSTAWKDLAVGNVMLIRDRGEIPADMIVLQTSEPGGQAYVETSNIDGETDLKLRYAVRQIAQAFPTREDLSRISGKFECDHPNDDLLKFVGSLEVPSSGVAGVVNKNVVLRGSSLRNTHWIIGLIVYTGSDTKVMKKAGSTRSKMSQVEKTMNSLLGVIFLAQFALCTLTTIAAAIWQAAWDNRLYYLQTSGPIYVVPSWLAEFFTFLILFNNFIPISLYVTVEMVNYMQAFFVDSDAAMYDPISDTPAKARTSNINQDLGQIEYVFSDKTGTLTRNIMEFKMFSTGRDMFGQFSADEGADEDDVFQSGGEAGGGGASKDTSAVFQDAKCSALLKGEPAPGVHATSAHVKEFFTLLAVCHTVVPEWSDGGELTYQAESPDEGALVKAAGRQGFQFRARTHDSITVRVQGTDEKYSWMGLHEFNADRKRMSVVVKAPGGKVLLICKGADSEMFKYCPEEPSRAQLEEHLSSFGELGLRTLVLAVREMPTAEAAAWEREYERASALSQGREQALAELAARSERDMRVVGATAIEDRLQDGVPETIRDLGRAGVKTWVLTGDKPETAINIGRSCQLLDASIPDENLIRITTGNQNAVAAQLDALSREFKLIHDDPRSFMDKLLKREASKLPGARSQRRMRGLSKSGTPGGQAATPPLLGDDTAHVTVNTSSVASSSYSLDSSTIAEKLRRANAEAESKAGSHATLVGQGAEAASVPGSPSHRSPSASNASGSGMPVSPLADVNMADVQVQTNMAVVVTGAALYHIIGHPEREKKFLITATLCKAVIACRVSPGQKASIIKMVKEGIKPRPMTLAIGDGANDVNMIQEAEVGVGISGKEGLQAVNSSDFAIAQFRFLKRLLLVHGRWSYVRMSKVVLYSFYKNVVITMALFCFNAFTGFSGTSFFESLVYSGYNFFLGLPIIMVGLFDRDLSERTVLSRPEVYMSGLYHMNLNVKYMLAWLAHAFIYAMIVFFLPWAAYQNAGPQWSATGLVDGMGVAGQTTYTCLVLAMQLKIGLPNITTTWTWVSHLFFWLSILGYFIFVVGYNGLMALAPNFYGVTFAMMERGPFWFVVLLTLGACFAFDLALEHLRLEYLADDIDGYILAERLGIPFPAAPWSEAPAVRHNTAADKGPRKASNPLNISPRSASPTHGSAVPASHYAYSFKHKPTVHGEAGSSSSSSLETELPSKTRRANKPQPAPQSQHALSSSRNVVEVRNVLAGMSSQQRASAVGTPRDASSSHSFAFSYPAHEAASDRRPQEEEDDIYG